MFPPPSQEWSEHLAPNQEARGTSAALQAPRLAPRIGDLTHSQSLWTESSDAVPHLVLSAPQRDERHITVAQVGRRLAPGGAAARLLQSLLRPHVAAILQDDVTRGRTRTG